MEKVLNKCTDVYKLPYYWTSTKIDDYLMGCYYNYFPELGEFFQHNLNPKFEKENIKIFTKIHMHYKRDTRRYWRLASVWYIDEENNEIPFMVIQNAGREGDDYSARIINDKRTFIEAVNYLRSLILNSSNIEQLIKDGIIKTPIKEIMMTNDDEDSEIGINTYIDDDNYPIVYTRQWWGTIGGVRKYATNTGLGYFYGQDYFETRDGKVDEDYSLTNGHIVIMKEEVDY